MAEVDNFSHQDNTGETTALLPAPRFKASRKEVMRSGLGRNLDWVRCVLATGDIIITRVDLNI